MEPKRISLIGPGDIEFHYHDTLGINQSDFNSQLEQISKALVNSGVEIELLPDKGVSLELSRLYKKSGGKKIIGAVPKQDKTFGIKHLEPYINEEINSKSLFDEIIDTGDWYKHDLIKGLLGNAILYLGSSPGTNGELNYAIYLYKLISGRKEGIDVAGKYIHKELKAGKDFSVIVYSPFILSGKLPKEDEIYMEKFGIKLFYVDSPKKLESVLKKL